jgi:SagB-type dehydrogenase family enzyme
MNLRMRDEPAHWTLLGPPRIDALSELFHENTKISPAARGFVISAETLKVMSAGFKVYRHADLVALPDPGAGLGMPVGEAMRQRRSERVFTGAPLTLEVISNLLFHGYGLADGGPARRLTPSGGGLFPLELYPILLNVDGADPGLYHYSVRGHALERLTQGVDLGLLRRAVFVDGLIEQASAAIVVTAVFGRSKIKYGERGYRFVLVETGHVAQNVILTATALGAGCCPIGGFVDDHVNNMLDIDGLDEAALYILVVGSVPSANPSAPQL